MTNDEHDAEMRNAYGSTGHPKAQSLTQDRERSGGVGGGYTDDYSMREWAGDWCNDNKEIVQKLMPLVQQSDYDALEAELMKYVPGNTHYQVKAYASEIADYLVDRYEGN